LQYTKYPLRLNLSCVVLKKVFNYLVIMLQSFLVLQSCGEKEPNNTPPVAVFTAGDNIGTIETIFTFDATGSYDLEDDKSELQIRWDWQDDGLWDTEFSTDKILEHGFGKEGFYIVKLEVMDTKGLRSDYSEVITVEKYLLVDPRDQKQYNTVKIGNQLWMAENLNYDNYTGSYCHNNDTDNCNVYGRLYEWDEATFVCPNGWRLPSNKDWQVLIDYLGDNAGNKLRSDQGWQSEMNGDNSSGFNALPASYLTSYGEFMKLGSYASFWSSTEQDSYRAWSMWLSYNKTNLQKFSYQKGNAFSVRCLKLE